MTNEVINRKESYILVQVDSQGVESALGIDYRNQFYPVGVSTAAYQINDENKAKQLAERINSLNELNYEFGIIKELVNIRAAKQVIETEYTEKTEPQA